MNDLDTFPIPPDPTDDSDPRIEAYLDQCFLPLEGEYPQALLDERRLECRDHLLARLRDWRIIHPERDGVELLLAHEDDPELRTEKFRKSHAHREQGVDRIGLALLASTPTAGFVLAAGFWHLLPQLGVPDLEAQRGAIAVLLPCGMFGPISAFVGAGIYKRWQCVAWFGMLTVLSALGLYELLNGCPHWLRSDILPNDFRIQNLVMLYVALCLPVSWFNARVGRRVFGNAFKEL